jgi:hypothetical protein
MSVVLYFDEDPYDDKKKTEERNFEEGTLKMVKEIVNGNKNKFSKLMMNNAVVKMAVK